MANEYYHINWVLSNIIKRKIVAMFIVTSGESLTLYKTRYVTNIIHVCKSKMKWCNLQVVSTLGRPGLVVRQSWSVYHGLGALIMMSLRLVQLLLATEEEPDTRGWTQLSSTATEGAKTIVSSLVVVVALRCSNPAATYTNNCTIMTMNAINI